MSNTEGLNEARAQLLEIAARLLIQEVDADALEGLRDPAFVEALEQYQPGVRADLNEVAKDLDVGLERLAVDYCALFLAHPATSPYASAWVAKASQPGNVLARDDAGNSGSRSDAKIAEPMTSDQILHSVDQWMGQLGMEIAPGAWGNVPRDHVAVLAGLVANALHRGPEGVQLANAIRDRALYWVGDFEKAVCARTRNPLYQAAVRMLNDALADA